MRYLVTEESPMQEKKLKISLVWYFDKASWVFPLYRDGVKAAMGVLEKRGHTVRWHLGTNPKIEDDSDFILVWDNSTSGFIPELSKYTCRKGLILTTDLGLDIGALRNYDVIFAEAQPVVDKIKPHGIRVIKAFGTDTGFFQKYDNDTEQIYEAFYPATFSPWKRQDLFAQKWGKDGLCIGTIQPDGWDILKETVLLGTNVFITYMPVEQLWEFYNKSQTVDITGWEGSGRTVIEAMSMNIPVTAHPDNHKCNSYIDEQKQSKLGLREFVRKYYSEEVYADNLLRGMYA